MGRPIGSQNRDKPFREALRLAIAEAEGNPRSLRKVAEKLIDKATEGDVTAIKEIADRLDGKAPQDVKHSGSVGTYDISKLSDEELDRLESILGPLAVAGADQGGEGEANG